MTEPMQNPRPSATPAGEPAAGPGSGTEPGPGTRAWPRSQRTGRGDTALAVVAAALAGLLVAFGVCAVVLGHLHVARARHRLASALFTAAAQQHRSLRDPQLLPAVAAQLRQGVRLTPTRTFRQTGAVLIRWRQLNGRTGAVCVVLPAHVGGRVTDCPPRLVPFGSGA
ncbi:MAG: hypothetical protein NVSMB55_25860 [Mycobacteriales bacterium]